MNSVIFYNPTRILRPTLDDGATSGDSMPSIELTQDRHGPASPKENMIPNKSNHIVMKVL